MPPCARRKRTLLYLWAINKHVSAKADIGQAELAGNEISACRADLMHCFRHANSATKISSNAWDLDDRNAQHKHQRKQRFSLAIA